MSWNCSRPGHPDEVPDDEACSACKREAGQMSASTYADVAGVAAGLLGGR